MPLYHDVAINNVLIIEPAKRLVGVLLVPSSVNWLPEPLIQAKNIIFSGFE